MLLARRHTCGEISWGSQKPEPKSRFGFAPRHGGENAEAIRNQGYEAAAFECNVLDKKSIENAKDEVLKKFGRLTYS